MKRSTRLIRPGFTVVFSVFLLHGAIDLPLVTAQPAKQEQKQRRLTFNKPVLSSAVRPGNRRRGGAGRGICPGGSLGLTALAPVYETEIGGNLKQTKIWGKTTASHPTLWFYVPFGKTDNTPQVEFVLQDSKGTLFYSTPIRPPEQPGIISIQIPETMAPLEVKQLYRWELRIQCDPVLFVNGWIERVADPTGNRARQTLSLVQRAQLYAANGIWYDALTVLGQARRQKLQDADLKELWRGLLAEVELQDFATQPIAE
jgi:hypothetical protein